MHIAIYVLYMSKLYICVSSVTWKNIYMQMELRFRVNIIVSQNHEDDGFGSIHVF